MFGDVVPVSGAPVDISLDGLNLATATGVCVLFYVHLLFSKVTVVGKRRHLSLVRLLSGFPCEKLYA
jgi:hypothetical protein